MSTQNRLVLDGGDSTQQYVNVRHDSKNKPKTLPKPKPLDSKRPSIEMLSEDTSTSPPPIAPRKHAIRSQSTDNDHSSKTTKPPLVSGLPKSKSLTENTADDLMVDTPVPNQTDTTKSENIEALAQTTTEQLTLDTPVPAKNSTKVLVKSPKSSVKSENIKSDWDIPYSMPTAPPTRTEITADVCSPCDDTNNGAGESLIFNTGGHLDCHDIFRNATVKVSAEKLRSCGICKIRINKTPYVCHDCDKTMCEGCRVKHGQTDLFLKHKVIDPSNDIPSLLGCYLHDNDPMKYFCKTCKLVMCTVCAMTADHDHHDKTIINQWKPLITDSIRALRTSLQTKLDHLEPNLDEALAKNEDIEQSFRIATDEIRTQADTAVAKIRQWEEDVQHNLKCQSENFRLWKTGVEKHQIAMANTNSLVTFIDEKLKDKRDFKLILEYKMLMSQGKDLIKQDNNIDPRDKFEAVLFQPNEGIEFDLGSISSQGYATLRKSEFVPTKPPEYMTMTQTAKNKITTNPTADTVSTEVKAKTMLWNVGKMGTIKQELMSPLCVRFFPNQDIIVSEVNGERLTLFDIDGKQKRVIGKGDLAPKGIAVFSDTEFYVINAQTDEIEIFNTEGKLINKWQNTKFQYPRGIDVTKRGNIVLTDKAAHSVGVYTRDGCLINYLGDCTFDAPVDVNVDSQGRIIFVDEGTQLIHMFDEDGTSIKTFWPLEGLRGVTTTTVRNMQGVCTDIDNNIYLALHRDNKIAKYSPEGRFIEYVLGMAEGVKWPACVAMDKTGYLAVTETFLPTEHGALKLFKIC